MWPAAFTRVRATERCRTGCAQTTALFRNAANNSTVQMYVLPVLSVSASEPPPAVAREVALAAARLGLCERESALVVSVESLLTTLAGPAPRTAVRVATARVGVESRHRTPSRTVPFGAGTDSGAGDSESLADSPVSSDGVTGMVSSPSRSPSPADSLAHRLVESAADGESALEVFKLALPVPVPPVRRLGARRTGWLGDATGSATHALASGLEGDSESLPVPVALAAPRRTGSRRLRRG